MSEPVNDGLERLTTVPRMAISALDGAEVDDGNDAMPKSPGKVDSCNSNVVTPVKGATVSLRSKSEVDVLDDGHRWRKYGQKAGSRSHPKSYFKCSYVGCSVKKRVERDPDDPEFVITTYKGIHNHNVVTPAAKTSSSHGSAECVVDGDSVCIGLDNSGINLVSDSSRISSGKSGITTEEEEYGHDVTFGGCYRKMDTRSSDVTPAGKLEVVTFRTKSKTDVIEDGYRWRKYGLKSVLGSPHPRCYYKCTHVGCPARKTVCRDSDAPEFVMTTVRHAHNHVAEATSRGKTTSNHDIVSPITMSGIEREESSRSHVTSLDFGTTMSFSAAQTRCNENFAQSDPLRFDIKTSFDLGIGMDLFAIDDFSDSFYSFPQSGMSFTSGNGKANAMLSPSSYWIGSGEQNDTMTVELQQHQEFNKVDKGMSEIEESRELQFQNFMPLPENVGNIYLSKSPSSSYSFCTQYFVSIFLPYCKLQQLWDGGMQLLVSLKHLDLKHSDLRWIPDLSKAQKLEDLELEGCINLVGISSIQHLTKLQHLNLKGCESLRGLPSLMKLKFLKTLNLSHCSNLNRLPPSLGCISSLCELNLRNCAKLDHLPRTVVQLMTSLETLNISGCSSLWNSITGILTSHTSEGSSLEPPQPITLVQEPPQPITLVQVDVVAATRASAVDSPPTEDLSLELRGKKAITLEDSNAFTREKTILAINDAGNNELEEEQVKNAAIIQKKDRQQILEDEEHEDAESVGNEPLKIAEATTSVCCKVDDCGVELSSEKNFHQRVGTCEVHRNTNTALVGKAMQQFCQQCSRFHLIEKFDAEERICNSRSAGYRQKRSRQSTTTTGTDSEEKFLLPKKTKTSDDTIALVETMKEFLRMSLEDLAEANAFGNMEHAVVAMVEQSSSLDDRAMLESVLVSLAEWKQSVPEIMMSMQNAEAESAVAAGETREMDGRLIRGELHLSLLDLELSLISEEEEQIEAEIQRLMDEKKRHLVLA